jgi:hypothetical protein
MSGVLRTQCTTALVLSVSHAPRSGSLETVFGDASRGTPIAETFL